MSENFPDCRETFQTVQKLSRLSENFPDSPETFQTVWKNFYLLQASFYDQFCTYAQFVHTHSLGQTNPSGWRGWKNTFFWRVFAHISSCSLLLGLIYVHDRDILKRKRALLSFFGHRDHSFKVPPLYRGHHRQFDQLGV